MVGLQWLAATGIFDLVKLQIRHPEMRSNALLLRDFCLRKKILRNENWA
jgi:hypothetical protein